MKTKAIAVLLGALIVLGIAAQGAVGVSLTPQDKEQLKWLFGYFETYVNQGNTQQIISLFSPNMPPERRTALTNGLYARIASGGVKLSFYPNLSDENIKEIKPGVMYEVSGTFSAQGPQWNVSGLSATFTVERVGYYFYIYDTNIIDKMSPETAFKTVGMILACHRRDLPVGGRGPDRHRGADRQEPEKEEGGGRHRRGAHDRIAPRGQRVLPGVPMREKTRAERSPAAPKRLKMRSTFSWGPSRHNMVGQW